jgi:leader peptidase (prepilin peptidase)/N-methyltransferase
MAPMLIPVVLGFVIGAVIGSFLNVCIHRLPRHESVVWPGSHCPACEAPIAPQDNVPILSYLRLGGRCRNCQAPISLQYPLVELGNAVGYALIVWRFGLTGPAVAYALFFSALLVVTAIDLGHLLIPDRITLPGILAGILCAVTVLPTGLLDSVLGILIGGGLLWGLAAASPYLFGKEGMGGGDIKLIAMIGAFLGWRQALLTIMVGAVAGSLVGLGLMAARRMERKQYLPFGPFLALGAILSLFFHRDLLDWYFGLLGG